MGVVEEEKAFGLSLLGLRVTNKNSLTAQCSGFFRASYSPTRLVRRSPLLPLTPSLLPHALHACVHVSSLPNEIKIHKNTLYQYIKKYSRISYECKCSHSAGFVASISAVRSVHSCMSSIGSDVHFATSCFQFHVRCDHIRQTRTNLPRPASPAAASPPPHSPPSLRYFPPFHPVVSGSLPPAGNISLTNDSQGRILVLPLPIAPLAQLFRCVILVSYAPARPFVAGGSLSMYLAPGRSQLLAVRVLL